MRVLALARSDDAVLASHWKWPELCRGRSVHRLGIQGLKVIEGQSAALEGMLETVRKFKVKLNMGNSGSIANDSNDFCNLDKS
ncbi:MAG: hypothetical protein JWM91_556 [Rhodospirillales bacterium]|nr:hypothetical protein [Rhodospirillales bacterium]